MIDVERSAVVSPDGRYRYLLERRWGNGPAIVWVMLNPSMADATVDDPTIRRVVSFSRTAPSHVGGVQVVNLFALRATDPRELRPAAAPIGPENDAHIETAVCAAFWVVVAWGANPRAVARAPEVLRIIRRYLTPYCLGTTRSGAPRHPLYVPASAPFVAFKPRPPEQ